MLSSHDSLSHYFYEMDVKDIEIINAVELWKRETALSSIPTMCMELDSILGTNGIQLGAVTELLGLPGTGKTQLCMQLCTSVQIPKELGGLDGEAIYVDTCLDFTSHRFREILLGHLEKCKRILGDSFTVDEDEALKRFHYVKAFGFIPFVAVMHILPDFIEEHPNIRLIVIDSLPFPFRGTDVSRRTRHGHIFRIMADLQRLAVQKRIAIVVSNSMSTRVGLSSGSLVGAMGDGWSHRPNCRVLLHERSALLLASNIVPQAVAAFQITKDGIRDLE